MKPEIQKIILEYYPNLTDLKRTWECAGKIEQSMIDDGYRKVPSVEELKVQLLPAMHSGMSIETFNRYAQSLHDWLKGRDE